MRGLGSGAGLEAVIEEEIGGRTIVFRDNAGVPRYTVGRSGFRWKCGVVAVVLEHIRARSLGLLDYEPHWIDGQGTEVEARRSIDPAPGKWAWLLDLAVEAGLVLDDAREG